MNDREFNTEFHMAEFQSLRSEIELHIADRRKVEVQLVLSVFSLYAWFFSRPSGFDPTLLSLAMGLPFAASIYGLLKWEALMNRTIQLGNYIKILEAEFTKTPGFGWEHVLKKERSSKPIAGQLEGQGVRVFLYALPISTTLIWIWFLFR